MTDRSTLSQEHNSSRQMIGDKLPEFVAPREDGLLPWSETVIITGIICALGWLASPQDPLLLNAPFPWLWLAPLLIALRYGVIFGVVSTLLLAIDWNVYNSLSASRGENFPLVNFLGGLVVTIIAGEFSDIWKARLNRSNEAQIYLGERLSRLSHQYYLLRISHDHMEQEMLSKPYSLRDAMEHLRDIRARVDDKSQPLPGIDYVLQVLAQYCRLEAAAVYIPQQDGNGGWIPGEPMAKLGDPPPLAESDPMLGYSMKHRGVSHIESVPSDPGDHLVMGPIPGGNDDVLGLVVVSRMPFIALNRDSLQFMALLLSYYGDILQATPGIERIRKTLPDCPYDVAEELTRLSHIAHRVGVESHLIVFSLCGDDAEELLSHIQRTQRSLSMTWRTERLDLLLLVVVLPLASRAAAKCYLQRMEKLLSDRFGSGFEENNVQINELTVGAKPPLEALAKLIGPQEIRRVA